VIGPSAASSYAKGKATLEPAANLVLVTSGNRDRTTAAAIGVPQDSGKTVEDELSEPLGYAVMLPEVAVAVVPDLHRRQISRKSRVRAYAGHSLQAIVG
jgi:hypothetical protein